MGLDCEGGSWRKEFGLGSSVHSSSATATTIPPVERDGCLVVAGEAVEAEGTGFLLTGSDLGMATLGRVGEEEGGMVAEEVSSRVGRPRFIILIHFSEHSPRVRRSPGR